MKVTIVIVGCIFFFLLADGQPTSHNSNQVLAKDIFKQLIEINTTRSAGNITIAADAIAKRLVAGGFSQDDLQIVGPTANNRSIVLRLHGKTKEKPILFLAHLDVVEAKKEDWTIDPFVFTEKDGYYYGRGTIDVKDGAAILIADFIRLKQEGYVPDRDLILALTAGEEGRPEFNGVLWLLEHNRNLIDAEYCVNMDGGGGRLENGQHKTIAFITSEKGYMDLQLTVKNPGGHSSVPSKDNAIYQLAKGLVRLEEYDFPVNLNSAGRGYFSTLAIIEKDQLSADAKGIIAVPPDTAAIRRLSTIPSYNALFRTTCVATMLEGGHAMNALSQTAIARINCRVMPGETQESVVSQIRSVLRDTQIVVTVTDTLRYVPETPMNDGLFNKVKKVAERFWPEIIVIPLMLRGASDGSYLASNGIPTYINSGVFGDVTDNRAHGKDERILITSFYEGLEYEYQLIKIIGKN